MSQGFQNAPSTEKMRDSRPKFLERDESLKTSFSGSSAPSDPSDGQWWLDTSGGGNGVLKQRRNGSWQVNDALTALLSSALDTATDLGGGSASNSKVPSQAAVKAYADALIAANDAMVFKGVIDCSGNPNYPAGSRGEVYKVSVAGKIGGASGPNVEVSDQLLCITDGTSGGNHATVGANWAIIQGNIDGAMTGPAGGVADGEIVLFNGTTGRIAKGGLTLDTDFTGAANSDARVMSQKAARKYIDDLREHNILDQISSSVTRAAIDDFTITSSLSSAIQAAADAADNYGNVVEFPTGQYPIDDTIVASNITLRGSEFLEALGPYGTRGSVIRVTSTSNEGIEVNGPSLCIDGFNIDYPNQVDVAATDVITYPPFMQNYGTASTIGGLRVKNTNYFGGTVFAAFGGVDTYNKGGLIEFENFNAAVIGTYFRVTHLPDMTQFDNCKFGVNILGDRALHFGSEGAGGILNISSITRSGSVVTVVTSAPHGLTMDSNPSVRGLNESGYNVEDIKLTEVTNSTTFKYAISTTPTSPGTGTGKVHNFKIRDAMRDAVWTEAWGNGATDTLATLSVDGWLVSNSGFYGGGTIYKIRGDGGSDQGGFMQIVSHSGGVIDFWRKLIEIDPGGCVYTFNVSGVSGFQGRVADPYTFDYFIDIDSPAPGRDASNNPIAICDVSFTEFELGFMRGGLFTITGSYMRRLKVKGACPDMLHCKTNGDYIAGVVDTPNAVVEVDMTFAGASHLATGTRTFIHITSNATNAIVRVRGAFKGWDCIIKNDSASATVTFEGVAYGLLGEAIQGTYATNVRCSTGTVFDLHQRAYNPLRLQGVYQAVNGFELGGAATGYRPYLKGVGDDTNVGLDLVSQGTSDFSSSISMKPGGFAGMTVRAVNNAVNFFYVLPAATTGAVFFGALGDDSNINMVISPKGTGQFFCSANALPLNSNTQALGSTSYMWADLFLGDGAVINFNNGDLTLTHSSNALTAVGAQLFWTYNGGAGLAPIRSINNTDAAAVCGIFIEGDRATPAANDEVFASFILSDSAGNQTEFGRMSVTGTAVTDGGETGRMDWFIQQSGTLTGKLRLNTAALAPYTSDGIALGSASLMWADLFLASGGVINFNNGDVTLTHSSDLLTVAGGKMRFAAGVVITPPASGVTPANNGDVEFEFTSNTHLTIKAKGGDGTTRSVVLTLA